MHSQKHLIGESAPKEGDACVVRWRATAKKNAVPEVLCAQVPLGASTTLALAVLLDEKAVLQQWLYNTSAGHWLRCPVCRSCNRQHMELAPLKC